MKLSVITINKNNALGLGQTVASVLAQTVQDFEYIIIDGDSTDGSVEIINDVLTRCKKVLSVKWLSEPDKGIYNAMNKGIQMATGEYLLFLNSGDSLASEDVVRKVNKEEFAADIVIGKCNVQKDGKTVWIYIPKKSYSFGTLFFHGISHQAAFIRKNVFERYGFYDESYKYNGDIEFWYRTIINNKVSTQDINFVVSNYCLGGLSDVLKDKPDFKEEHKRIMSNPLYEKFIGDYVEWKKDREWIERYRVVGNYPSMVGLLNRLERLRRRFCKVKKYFRDPYYEIGSVMFRKHPNRMPDKWYLKVCWKSLYGSELDLKHPKTFNEKLNWLKLYDRKPIYTTLVDKYRVKQWVAERIGEKFVIPTIAVYASVDEIDLDKLPNQFVLKCNHDSGTVVICQDKSSFDLREAKRKLEASLKKDFYMQCREWPYKNVARCVIAEELIKPGLDMKYLPDYKFFCFDGEVKGLFVATERQNPYEDVKFDFFDADYNHLPFCQGHENAKVTPQKPKNFDLMKTIATKLSKGIPFVRVDLYDLIDKVYFGEMTLYHFGGMAAFKPAEWDNHLGNMIALPGIK